MCCLKRLYVFILLSFICIQAGAQLNADFTANIQENCSPLVVKFTDLSTGSPQQWFWDLGNGATSTLRNPGAIYITPGTYTVKLRIRNAAGDEDSITKTDYITVHENPRPELLAFPDEGCAPLTVQFTDISFAGTGNITSWFWDFGDGNVSEEANPQHVYNISDTFNVSLTVENSAGCRKTIVNTDLIKIKSFLSVSMAYSYDNACKPPATVSFRNTSRSSTPIISSTWLFGDGTSSTEKDPVHVYTRSGDFTVQLITETEGGCIDTTEQLLSIGDAKAAFSHTNACVNEPMVFTDESVPNALAQTWYFGDGDSATGPVVSHTYRTANTYEVTLIADFGQCFDTIKQTVQTAQKVQVDFNASGNLVSCDYPQTISFTNLTRNATSYKWYFGDNSAVDTTLNPIHTYNNPGQYTVKLVAYNGAGCSDSIVKISLVKIGPPVISSIRNLPASGCAPQIVTMVPVITAGPRIVSYSWDFGDGTTSSDSVPTHTYPNPGVYDVVLTVTAEGGCSDTLLIVDAVTVAEKPKAAFNAYPVLACAETPIQFTDSTLGRHTTWLWLFGDGTTSTEQNPEHYYADTGFKTVTLIVSDNMCFDTVVLSNYIYIQAPIAAFSHSFKCNLPFDYSFTDRSIDAETWAWDFGDGVTSREQNPLHTYTSKGKFGVSLTVTNGSCSYTMTDSVNIIQENPSFTYNPLSTNFCKYDSIHFVVNNYDPANIRTFQWDFGDGVRTTANLKYADTYHRYLKSGTYNPVLFTIDANNCRDTVNRNLQMQIYGPVAAFDNKAGDCIHSTIDFIDQSTGDGTHTINKWVWNYGDGSLPDTLSAGPFSHLYGTEGLFTVKLKVFDTNNCYDSIVSTQAVDITQPIAAFGVADTVKCSANLVQFIDSSHGKELQYTWDFGDGSTGTGSSPSHSYASEGIYTIKLSLLDKFGCVDSITKPNYITVANPVAAFSLTDSVFACPPATVSIVNNSSRYNEVSWHFGDGNSSSEISPIHTYATAGSYQLWLVAKGFGDCYDSANTRIVVRGPAARLFYSPFKGCDSLHVSFYTHSTNTVQYIWDFGDGNLITGTDSIAEYTYLKPGSYLPKLIISDDAGCQVPVINYDTLLVSSVKAGFSPVFRDGVCDSTGVDFIDSSIVLFDQIERYRWQFGDGTVSSQSQPSHFYTEPGLYNVSLDVTTENGCANNYSLPLNISIDTTTQIFATVPDSACVNMPVTLNAGTIGNPSTLSWVWNLGDGSNAHSEDTVYTYASAGLKQLMTVATAPSGCADTAFNTLEIVGLPLVDAGADVQICLGEAASLQASGATAYTWVADATLSCTNCASPTANPATDNVYFVTGANTFGCIAIDSVQVKVVQPVTVSISAGDTSCAGDTIHLHASGASVYSWQPASLVSDPSAASVISSPTSTTTYTVTGRDSAGCFSDTASAFVHVSPYPTVDIADSAVTVLVGSEYQIVTQGSADIVRWQWRPLDNLSCPDCPQPVVRVKASQTYTVNVQNATGCAAEDDITITVLCKDQNLFMPNTFSPNNDGMNDYFYPRGKGLAIIKSLKIFNRWGTLIFERHNFPPNQQSYGWDGRYNGSALPADVYIFIAEISCDNNTVINSKGNVTLLR